MNNTFNYLNARNYASQYGAIVGLCWIVSFLCYMGGLRTPFLGDIGMIMGISSIFVAGNIIRYYHNMRQNLNFRQAWWMALILYFCATILTALAQFIYFRYMDHGMLAQTYEQILTAPEYQNLLQNVLPQGADKEMIDSLISLFYSITPIQMTFQLLIYNIFLGLILSLPTAFLGHRKKRYNKADTN